MLSIPLTFKWNYWVQVFLAYQGIYLFYTGFTGS